MYKFILDRRENHCKNDENENSTNTIFVINNFSETEEPLIACFSIRKWTAIAYPEIKYYLFVAETGNYTDEVRNVLRIDGAGRNLDHPVIFLDHLDVFVDGTDLSYGVENSFNTYVIIPPPKARTVFNTETKEYVEAPKQEIISTHEEVVRTDIFRIMPISRKLYVNDNVIKYIDNATATSADFYSVQEKIIPFSSTVSFNTTDFEIMLVQSHEKETVFFKGLFFSSESIQSLKFLILGGRKEFSMFLRDNVYYLKEHAPSPLPPARRNDLANQIIPRTARYADVPRASASEDDDEAKIFAEAYIEQQSGDVLRHIYSYAGTQHPILFSQEKYIRDKLQVRDDFNAVWERYKWSTYEIKDDYMKRYKWKVPDRLKIELNYVCGSRWYTILYLFFSKQLIGCKTLILKIDNMQNVNFESNLVSTLREDGNVYKIVKLYLSSPELEKESKITILELEWAYFLSFIKNFKIFNKTETFASWLVDRNFYHPLLYNLLIIFDDSERLEKFFPLQQKNDPYWSPPYFPRELFGETVRVLGEHNINYQKYIDLFEIMASRRVISRLLETIQSIHHFGIALRNIDIPLEVPNFKSVEEAENYRNKLKDQIEFLRDFYTTAKKEYKKDLLEAVRGRLFGDVRPEDLDNDNLMQNLGDVNRRILDFYIQRMENMANEEEIPEEKRPEEKRGEGEHLLPLALPDNWRELNDVEKYQLLRKYELSFASFVMAEQKEKLYRKISRLLRDTINFEEYYNQFELITDLWMGNKRLNLETNLQNLSFGELKDLYFYMEIVNRKIFLMGLLNKYARHRQEFIREEFKETDLEEPRFINRFDTNTLYYNLARIKKYTTLTADEYDLEFIAEHNFVFDKNIDANTVEAENDEQIVYGDEVLDDIIEARMRMPNGRPILPNIGEIIPEGEEGYIPPPICILDNGDSLLDNFRQIFYISNAQKLQYIKYLLRDITNIFDNNVSEQFYRRIPIFSQVITPDENMRENIGFMDTYYYHITSTLAIHRLPNTPEIRQMMFEETVELARRFDEILRDFNRRMEINIQNENIIIRNNLVLSDLVRAKRILNILIEIYGVPALPVPAE